MVLVTSCRARARGSYPCCVGYTRLLATSVFPPRENCLQLKSRCLRGKNQHSQGRRRENSDQRKPISQEKRKELFFSVLAPISPAQMSPEWEPELLTLFAELYGTLCLLLLLPK